MSDVQLSSELVLERLGRLELRYKRAGAISEAGGIRLAIVEVMRIAGEAKPKPGNAEVSPLVTRST